MSRTVNRSAAQGLYRREALKKLVPPKGSALSTRELSERLANQGIQLHIRSVQRGLNDLKTAFPSHIRQQRRDGQFYWWTEKPLLSQALLPAEALGVLMLVQHAQRFGLSMFQQPLDALTEYAETQLEAASSNLKEWPRRIMTNTRFVTLRPAKISPDVLDVLYKAMIENRAVEVDYLKRGSDAATQYVINVLGLSLQDSNIYVSLTLSGDDVKGPMAWPLHRFKQAKLAWQTSSIPDGYDIRNTRSLQSLLSIRSEEPISLRLRLDLALFERLSENPLEIDQVITPEGDGRWLLECQIPPSQGLDLWLLSQGASVEVLGPPDQRARIAEKAIAAAALYQ
jgi:predicted DNA-binding transcriptional regulator YafY